MIYTEDDQENRSGTMDNSTHMKAGREEKDAPHHRILREKEGETC
jgi:hypothetical protein